MNDKLHLKPYPLIHPTTICLVGTIVNDKPNWTTIGDVAVAGLNPPLVMMSLHAEHGAMRYIDTHHKLSVNIPTAAMVAKVDFAGIHSSKQVDKSNLFEHRMEDGLPVIADAPIALLLKELSRVQVKHRVVLVCEVYDTIVDASLVPSGRLSLESLKTVLYGLDNRYYTTGDIIGEGYKSGLTK